MADFYIAYSHLDKKSISTIYATLSSRWNLWWDDGLVGKYPARLEKEIEGCKCVLFFLSESSRSSDHVLDELRYAKKLGREILPIRLDSCASPMGFGSYSYIDLNNWGENLQHEEFLHLQRKMTAVVLPIAPASRGSISSGLNLTFPSVFLSVSSHETRLSPIDAIRALRIFNPPTILISAYDLVDSRRPKGFVEELEKYKSQGGVVLIDSGNYESSRGEDSSWSQDDFGRVLVDVPHDMAFSFDVMNPQLSWQAAVEEVIGGVVYDQRHTSAPILPIIHAPTSEKFSDFEFLPKVVFEVSNKVRPPIVAIPERELGPGIIERTRMMVRIRAELDKLPFYQPIHLLGTGNPLSIALLCAAGADSFDGLEWCRMVVDRNTHTLHHFHHFDFFSYQASVADSEITRAAMVDKSIDYAGKAAFHNLDYYMEFTKLLRDAAASDRLEVLILSLLGNTGMEQLREKFPELLV